MPYIIDLQSFKDKRGKLTVIEKLLPFDIKRVFYIYDVDEWTLRGGHRHRKNIQAAICIHGACRIDTDNGSKKESFILDQPNKCLILEPQDRHTMHFSDNGKLMVLASEYFDAEDYIADPISSL